MAKISARGDTEAIRLRKPDGAYVVVTRKGRLLAQAYKGAGYTLMAHHWVREGSTITHRQSIIDYLTQHEFPGAVEA